MLKHVVMWKLKDFAEGNDKQANGLKVTELLEGLKYKISEIISINVGIAVSSDADNFDIILESEFLDKSSLEKYLNHPEHKKVGEFIGKIRVDRISIDYEL